MYSRAVFTTLLSNTLKTCPRFCRLASGSTTTTSVPSSSASPEALSKENTPPKSSKQKDQTVIFDTDRPAIKNGKANPFNTILLFVPQEEAWIVERMGKFHTVLHAGRHLLLPFVDKIGYVQSLKEIIIEVPSLNVITSEGVSVRVDSLLHVSVTDPQKASYGTDDPEYAAVQLAQTVLSAEVSKLPVQRLISHRETISEEILDQLNKNTAGWGVTCTRFSIRELNLPRDVQEALHQQLITEQRKQIARLESEAVIATELSRAESKQQVLLKYLEAKTNARYQYAKSEAAAILTLAEARANELEIISKALAKHSGREAAAVRMAEEFVAAISKSKLPLDKNDINNIPDVPRTVTEAMDLFEKITRNINSASDGDEEYISDREGSRN